MPQHHYTFVTTWKIPAPLSEVWAQLADVEGWPAWWKGVKNVEVITLAPENAGIGTKVKSQWKSWLPYTISFSIEVIDLDPGKKLSVAARGDLNGVGTWELHEKAGTTTATYTWSVSTAKPWMNLVAPIAKPLFAHAHHTIMRWGERGLSAMLAKE
jgi:uncharacterized protein YndB with AHSA1/START domain